MTGVQTCALPILTADATQARRLQWAALGEALGTRNRWMAPSSDGTRLMAVHTPHIGGVLHEYRLDGDRLVGRAVANDLSTHRIGSRELDLAVWLGSRLVVPQQDGLALRVLDAAAAWAEVASVAVPSRVAMTAALSGTQGTQGLAALLDDGSVFSIGMP